MYRQLNTLRRHKWKLVICLGAARECSGSAPASLFTASFLPPYDGNAFKCISEEIHVCVQLHLIYYAS